MDLVLTVDERSESLTSEDGEAVERSDADGRHVIEVSVTRALHTKIEDALALMPDAAGALERALDLLLADLRSKAGTMPHSRGSEKASGA